MFGKKIPMENICSVDGRYYGRVPTCAFLVLVAAGLADPQIIYGGQGSTHNLSEFFLPDQALEYLSQNPGHCDQCGNSHRLQP